MICVSIITRQLLTRPTFSGQVAHVRQLSSDVQDVTTAGLDLVGSGIDANIVVLMMLINMLRQTFGDGSVVVSLPDPVATLETLGGTEILVSESKASDEQALQFREPFLEMEPESAMELEKLVRHILMALQAAGVPFAKISSLLSHIAKNARTHQDLRDNLAQEQELFRALSEKYPNWQEVARTAGVQKALDELQSVLTYRRGIFFPLGYRVELTHWTLRFIPRPLCNVLLKACRESCYARLMEAQNRLARLLATEEALGPGNPNTRRTAPSDNDDAPRRLMVRLKICVMVLTAVALARQLGEWYESYRLHVESNRLHVQVRHLETEGRLQEAEDLQMHVYKRSQELKGESDVRTIKELLELARITSKLGKVGTAKYRVQDALNIARKAHGESHDITRECEKALKDVDFWALGWRVWRRFW
jgi:hypothetical protein